MHPAQLCFLQGPFGRLPALAAAVQLMLSLVLPPAVALAQSAQSSAPWTVGFPAVRWLAPPAVDQSSSAGGWLIGGHSLQHFDIADWQAAQPTDWPDQVLHDGLWVDAQRLLVAGACDIEQGCLATCDAATGDLIWRRDDLPHPLTCVAATENLAIAGDDRGRISAFEMASGQPVWSREMHTKLVTAMVAIDSQICVSSDWGGKIVVFEAASGQELTNFQQHRDRVTDLAVWTDDDANPNTPPRLFSGSRDGTVRLWYPQQRRLVRFVQLDAPVTALLPLSRDRVWVATNDARLHLLDMERARVLASMASGLNYVVELARRDATSLLALNGTGQLVRLPLPSGQSAP